MKKRKKEWHNIEKTKDPSRGRPDIAMNRFPAHWIFSWIMSQLNTVMLPQALRCQTAKDL